MYRRLRCFQAPPLIFCVLPVVAACGAEPTESTLEVSQLTASQSDVEARLYESTLTNYVAALQHKGHDGSWTWFVGDPEVELNASGATLQGTLFAQERFPPRGREPLLYRKSFSLPLSFGYAAGRIRMDVAPGTVRVQRSGVSRLENLVSIQPSTLYSASFPLSGFELPLGGGALQVDASQVQIDVLSGRLRVRAVFQVQ